MPRRFTKLVRQGRHRQWLAVLLLGAGTGCSDLSGLAGTQQLPAGVSDPKSLETQAGALAAYRGVVTKFANGVKNFMQQSGLLTDELTDGQLGGPPTQTSVNIVDARQLPDGVREIGGERGLYIDLQALRNAAHLASQALAKYDTSDSPALRGQLFAMAGYTELFLADLYCSGVPLSTTDFQGDFTYHPGLPTAELYHAAIAQFDTALTLSADSARIMTLARIGRGRAYLALGQYDSAAAAIGGVLPGDKYQIPLEWGGQDAGGGIFSGASVADSEGIHGLPYRSSGDPRSLSEMWGRNSYGLPGYAPVAYGGAALGQAGASFVAPLTLASGVEAQLIAAEVALKEGSAQWLTILNTLRTSGVVAQPADTIADTLGITGCGPDAAHWCTSDGVTNGYFVVPAGYTLTPALGFTLQPVGATLSSACVANSYYTPCYSADGSAEVRVYVRPAGMAASAGTGGVAGLSPLQDPGASPGDTARIRLLFRERAFWLFLTGHRQGDLRRLIRNYKFAPGTIYPTGPYAVFGQLYGSYVDIPVPQDELVNPLFHGCLARGA